MDEMALHSLLRAQEHKCLLNDESKGVEHGIEQNI
jgi:hypothetical protein